MDQAASPRRVEQPHLVSLVLQSKKALQQGGLLCSTADNISKSSAQCAVDVLALDARVRWISDAVAEQLKLAASVAKSIEEKRAQLRRSITEWDASRVHHADDLERVLESLGGQYVPPGFHQTSSDSSLFGSQHSLNGKAEERARNGHAISAQTSPSATILGLQDGRVHSDRRKWKTLRDFVDDGAIEDALETIENDRTALDNTLAKTDHFSETLLKSIATIEEALQSSQTLPVIEKEISTQHELMHAMAKHLESLTCHYDEMSNALHDGENGEVFTDDDMEAMNRDTDELPAIMAELEDSVSVIQAAHDRLVHAKQTLEERTESLPSVLDDLDELGDIMTEMLETQQNTEADVDSQLTGLEQHLVTLEHLVQQFVSYRNSFSKLILEIARRRQYNEAAENIVKGMLAQLTAMTNEETQVRDHFNEEHGAHLPEDICLCISNLPTRWQVVPLLDETAETFPDIDEDLISEAMARVHGGDRIGPESI
ncbi:autophagy protein 17 [Pleurotus pulmonarius]|nr:autophagy protein 17 [Pleurotus pulmonarius]